MEAGNPQGGGRAGHREDPTATPDEPPHLPRDKTQTHAWYGSQVPEHLPKKPAPPCSHTPHSPRTVRKRAPDFLLDVKGQGRPAWTLGLTLRVLCESIPICSGAASFLRSLFKIISTERLPLN